MAQFQAFEEGMEVNGQTIIAVVDGLGASGSLAIGYLEKAGLPEIIAGIDHWYPQQAWLDVFRAIADELGDAVLFRIGLRIPENAAFPKGFDSVEGALVAIDVAYHMNHRNGHGEVLFDPSRPAARRMLEGIGHYRFERRAPGSAVVVSDTPYPCAFDRGIVEAMARLFASAQVRHVDGAGCRKDGAPSCTYAVSW